MNRRIAIGIWIELSELTLQECKGEGIVKWIRALGRGLAQHRDVRKIVIPCNEQSRTTLQALIVDVDPALICKFEFPSLSTPMDGVRPFEPRQTPAKRAKEKLLKLGARRNPLSWPRACWNQAKQRRSFKRKVDSVFETLFKLTCITAKSAVQTTVEHVRKLGKHAWNAFPRKPQNFQVDCWIIPNPTWTGAYRYSGKKIVNIPDLAYLEFEMEGVEEHEIRSTHARVLESIQSSDALVCFSKHVATNHISPILVGDARAVHLIPHAPIIHKNSRPDAAFDRLKMANDLRGYYRSPRVDRYLCDFPFENIEYIFASSKCRPYKNFERLLLCYEQLLRRQRRNIKLITTAKLRGNPAIEKRLMEKGLVFDVIECPEVDEELHEALVQNSRCLVIPTLFEGGFPFGFSEAVERGIPVSASRIAAVREVLGVDAESPEYFDPLSVVDMVRGIGFVLDNPTEVLDRQAAIAQRLKCRTWSDVANDYLRCVA